MNFVITDLILRAIKGDLVRDGVREQSRKSISRKSGETKRGDSLERVGRQKEEIPGEGGG